MKLLICGYCNDIFNLKINEYKECSCGKTAGAYIDNERAVYSGDHLGCLAIHNKWYWLAVNNRLENYHVGDRTFIGWCVPEGSPDGNFTKVDDVKKYMPTIIKRSEE